MKLQFGFGAAAGLALVAVGGFLVWRASRAASSAFGTVEQWAQQAADALGQTVGAVGDAINPVSPTNLAYRGVNAGLTAAAGEPTYVSDALFAVLQPGARAAERDLFAPSVPAPSVYDDEDAALGVAMRGASTNTPGGAFIGYGHAFGRARR